MKNIVIAGHGVAGLTAGDTLRSLGYKGTLTIVGQEPHPTYSRPALSKAMLTPGAELEINFLPEPSYDANQFLGREVAGLDHNARIISLDDGTELFYDGLVIATGAQARRFTDSPDEYTLRSIDDAAALKKRLCSQPRVTIIGGGPLGMEVASGAVSLGCQVTLVEAGPPMHQQMGAFIANVLSEAARESGVEIIQAMVNKIESPERGGGLEVQLDNGRSLHSEVVVSAIGDKPNDHWLLDSGLLTDGRLVVDSRCRVRHDITAAGDVAWLMGPNGPRRQPVWTSAIEQGKTAAAALLFGDNADPLEFQPYFWTDQFGLSVKICGPIPSGNQEPVVVEGDLGQRKAVLHWPKTGTAATINFRFPIPKLRKLALSHEGVF